MSERSLSQYKKELLYRKVNGKKIFNDYLDKIASLFPSEEQPDIVPLEETDATLDRFKTASVCLHQESVRISASGLHAELSAIKNNPGMFYVFIDDDWKYCGMLMVKNLRGLNERLDFGEKILNDIIFMSGDLSVVASFDFFEVAGDHYIDVKRWQRK